MLERMSPASPPPFDTFLRYLQAEEAAELPEAVVHYTTAENAFKILSTSTLWLRDARLMNDFAEVEYGRAFIERAFQGGLERRLKDCLPTGREDDILKWAFLHSLRPLPGFDQATFISSFSAHHSAENDTGRLSMWRAYGGRSGVALVFNSSLLRAFDAFASIDARKVRYRSMDEADAWFADWVSDIEKDRSLLKASDANLSTPLAAALRVILQTTKHPAFREEAEWRLIHGWDGWGDREVIAREWECIDPVPQEVIKLNLNAQNVSIQRPAALAATLQRVIVGPCEFPKNVIAALRSAMRMADVPETVEIGYSGIPLRHV